MDKFYNYVQNLSDESKQLLTDYTNDYGITMRQEESLLEIFDKGPRVLETYTLYRGLENPYNENGSGFMSTTLDIKRAKNFIYEDCCMYVITITPGDYSILPVESVSVYPEELEVILPPGKLSIQMTSVLDGIQTTYCTYIPRDSLIINTSDCIECVTL